jgi:hypothetical protein
MLLRGEISSLCDELMRIVGGSSFRTTAAQSANILLPDDEGFLAIPGKPDSLLHAEHGDEILHKEHQIPQAPQGEEMRSVTLNLHDVWDETSSEHDTFES